MINLEAATGQSVPLNQEAHTLSIGQELLEILILTHALE